MLKSENGLCGGNTYTYDERRDDLAIDQKTGIVDKEHDEQRDGHDTAYDSGLHDCFDDAPVEVNR